MPLETRISVAPLREWILRIDDHAEARVPLLERAAAILGGEVKAGEDDRLELSARLERWRYQYLNERSGAITSEDRRLVDTLDLAANELAGRRARPPRRTRRLLADDSLVTNRMAEAIDMLDRRVSLDDLVERATALTIERFGDPVAAGMPGAGRRMLLYAPLYLSNHCINHCTYCGFRYPLSIDRTHLTFEQAKKEADILIARGFRHLLLVGGDFPRLTTPEYYGRVIKHLSERRVATAVEIAAQSTANYARLARAGACGVTLYQETYDERLYAEYHPRGSKASYDWRFEALDRAADGGIRRLGLGVLLGLADPVADLTALMRHASYLQSRHEGATLAFSLPRIHEAPQDFRPPYDVDDELFIRFYCVLRLAFPDAPLVLSTREPATLRNRLAAICITQMSAGSSTAPGGYEDADRQASREQFPVTDHRPVETVAQWLSDRAFRLTWEIESR